jgi:rhomboid protease GluP
MTLNYILLWVTGGSCATTLARTFPTMRSTGRGWFMVSLFTLVVTGLAAIVNADYAGYIGGFFWAVLILAPSIASRMLASAIVAQKFGEARVLAKVAATLHPFDGWQDQPALLEALEKAHRSGLEEAVATLRPFLESDAPVSGIAAASYFRITGQWEEALDWLRVHPVPALSDPSLLLLYIRALGETGNIEGMIQILMNGNTLLQRIPSFGLYARLFAFAFAGRKATLERLLRDGRLKLPPAADAFWLATAEMACGKREAGAALLRTIPKSTSLAWKTSITRRMSYPVRVVSGKLSPTTEAKIARLEAEYFEEESYAAVLRPNLRRAHVTTVLILVNIVAYFVEAVEGGATNLDTLYRLGALYPPAVLKGEWLRVIASTFLHFGFLHLSLNMLGLLVLGPFVELTAGVRRFLIIYLGSGIGSMLLIVLINIRTEPADLVLGASGSIMGIVGATAAILWNGWRRYRSRVARQRLAAVILIIVFQVVFDFSTPEVSFLGHTLGVLIGFFMARSMMIEPVRSPS